MLLSDSARMRAADATAIGLCGIPSPALMRRAAAHLAEAARRLMEDRDSNSAVIFCGVGNNGGDGAATAALLLQAGVQVRALLVGDKRRLSPDMRLMTAELEALGGALEPFDPAEPGLAQALSNAGVVVDAICGIGLSRPVTGAAAQAVALMNGCGAPRLAADIPTGVSADTGEILGVAVDCAVTVTFSMAKPGHFIEPGCLCCGEIEIADIGIPAARLQDAVCGVRAVTGGDVSLPRRPRLSHKGDFGRLLIVGGSVGYTGAANLCARAAVRAGAGLVSLGVPRDVWPVCAVKNDEAMPFPLPCDGDGRLTAEAISPLLEKLSGCRAAVLGPGLGRSDGVGAVVRALVTEARCQLVLDADALWALSDDPALLKKAATPPVLTPHAGEFARLGGDRTGARLPDARAFAAAYNCVVVLKGHRTLVVYPDGQAHIIVAGNPGMARGGSGDVLAGVIGGLLAQFSQVDMTTTACWLHATAGDACARERGEYGMTPSDMIEMLPTVMKGIAGEV